MLHHEEVLFRIADTTFLCYQSRLSIKRYLGLLHRWGVQKRTKMQPLPIRILLSPCEPKILSRSCGSLDSSRQCVTQLPSFPFYRRHWHFRTGNLLQVWAPCHERKTNGSLRWSASDDGTEMEAHRSWQKIATVFGSNQILWVLGRKQKVKQNFMKHPPQGYHHFLCEGRLTYIHLCMYYRTSKSGHF